MKHYDYIEWLLYKEKMIGEDKLEEMEEHLYICDECMDTFLSLINKGEVYKAQKSISSDFTKGIMGNIKNIEYKPKLKAKKSIIKAKDILGYYIAVASVAIVLTLGGFYSGLVDMVPHVTKSVAKKNNIAFPNMVADISGKMVNKTSNFINNFEISNMKEDLK